MASSSARPPHLSASLEPDAFARARLSELASLRAAVRGGRSNRRVHQQLAWHLRRRTLSHSSRRAPASIRAAHARELRGAPGASPTAPIGPRGSRRLRKYRERARFLRAHRALRNARPSRLETHEWHAKRFRMKAVAGTQADGERMAAERCNDRGERSAFRALAHSSIAHDASYLDVVAVAGEREDVARALRKALAQQDAMRALAAPVAEGRTLARGLLAVTPDGGRAIAPVDALFRPGGRVVWLWVHPAASAAVARAMTAGGGGIVDVRVHRGDVVTFALRGPRAGFILGAALERADAHGREWDVVRYARSPACAPAGVVVAGEAVDPRANFPPRRVREHADKSGEMVEELASARGRSAFAASSAESRVWDLEEAAEGAAKADGRKATMPFLLMQRPAGLDRGLGAGWDVVVPKGWGRPLWRALMYANGARAVGLTEWRHFELETGQCVFPDDFPDSLEADQAMQEKGRAMAERYYRRPKSKRVNYFLYRVPSPFFPNLKSIAEGKTLAKADGRDDGVLPARARKRRRFSEPSDASAAATAAADGEALADVKIDVLRDRKTLREVLGRGNGRMRHVQRKLVAVSDVELRMRALAVEETSRNKAGSFVRAAIKPMGRGVVVQNALICALTEEDLVCLARGVLPEVKERLGKKGDEDASRTCIGRVVHGNFSMARGIPIGIAFLKLDQVQKLRADARAVPRERRGRRDAEGVQLRVLLRNVDSLQYRLAVATVSW